MKRAIILLTLALAGCNDDKPQPQPRPQAREGWSILHSSGMPPTTDGNFEFPHKPNEIDYVSRMCTGGNKSLKIVYRVVGDGELAPSEGQPPPLIRLFLQRRGDDLTLSRGPSYRFWSRPGPLSPGEHTLEAQLVSGQWTNVNGQHDEGGFQALLNECGNEGFTFGGQFAGHGVYVLNGSVRFNLLSYGRGS